MEQEEVKHKAIRSIVALTGRTLLLQLANSLTLIVLLGFLNASQIGVYIVVSAVIRIFNLFTDVGLGAALIQKKDEVTKTDLKVAFTIQELLVVSAVVLGFVMTPVVQKWANLNSEGVFLYFALLCILFISSLKVIPSILLERTLAFEKQVIPQVIEAIVFDIAVIFLAVKGFGVSSYTWSFLLSAIVGLPIYYLISPWKPGWLWDTNAAKKLVKYGIAYQGKSFLAVAKDDLLTFFLSGFVGTTGVGYWGTAQRFAYFPYRFIVDSVTKVTFPAYSRIQHDASALRSGIEKSLFGVSLVLFPIMTLVSLLAKSAMEIYPRYSKWEPALVSLYFLSAQACLAAIQNILVNVLDATGRVKTTLGLMVFWIASTWILTIILVTKFGFTGIAMAAFLVNLSIIAVVIMVKRVVDFNFIQPIYRQIASSAVMGAVVYLVLMNLPVNLLTVVAAALSGAIIYIVLMVVLAKEELVLNARTIIRAFRR